MNSGINQKRKSILRLCACVFRQIKNQNTKDQNIKDKKSKIKKSKIKIKDKK